MEAPAPSWASVDVRRAVAVGDLQASRGGAEYKGAEYKGVVHPSAEEGALARIRGRRAAMPAALQRVADQVLASPQSVARLTLVELAERSRTSAGTITRFCRAAGFNGYPDLRLALVAAPAASQADWHAEVGRQVQEDSPVEALAAAIAADAAASVRGALDAADGIAVADCAKALVEARRIDVFGVGGSRPIAEELQLRLHRLGRPTWTWADPHSALTSAALLAPGDVLVVISGRGRSVECIDVAREGRSRGALTVALTGEASSPLAAASELVIATHAGSGDLRADSRLRYAQLAVVDLLYLAVVQKLAIAADQALSRTAEAISPRIIVS